MVTSLCARPHIFSPRVNNGDQSLRSTAYKTGHSLMRSTAYKTGHYYWEKSLRVSRLDFSALLIFFFCVCKNGALSFASSVLLIFLFCGEGGKEKRKNLRKKSWLLCAAYIPYFFWKKAFRTFYQQKVYIPTNDVFNLLAGVWPGPFPPDAE